jgi:AcrR family transcriptional regulator
LAERLGVATMTLYGYVPGKAELLDLLLDAAYARMPRTNTSGMPWRHRVTAVADENRALFETHPWAATVSTSRPPLGPGLMAKYEHELSALDGLGLTDAQMDDSLTFVLSFVQGWARDAAAARDVRSDTATDDEQWWATNPPVLERVFDEEAYPLAVRIGGSAPWRQVAPLHPRRPSSLLRPRGAAGGLAGRPGGRPGTRA